MEHSIIRSRGSDVDDLLIGLYGFVKPACVELAVAYAVQRIGVGRLRGVALTDKILEHSLSLHVHPLLEVRIALQV